MCPGSSLCARHSASLSCWLLTPLHVSVNTMTATLQVSMRRSTVDDWPGVSSGDSSSLEQSTRCDETRQLTAAVSSRDKGTSISSASRYWTNSLTAADSLTYANNMQFIVFSAPATSPMRQCHFNLCFSYHVPTVITVNINRKSHIRPISNGVISAVLFKGEYYSNRCILLYMYCPTTDNLFT